MLYLALPFVGFLVNLVLFALVVSKIQRQQARRLLAYFLLSMSLWGLTIYLMRASPDLGHALLWERFVIAVLALVALFHFHFVLVFTGYRARRWVIPAVYGATIAWLPFVWTGLLVQGMRINFYGYAPELGVLFVPWVAWLHVLTFSALIILWKAGRATQDEQEGDRITYVFIGTAISVLGAVTDYVAALDVIPVYPLGILGNILFSLLMAVAILKYNLLDIRVALRRSMVFSIASAGIFGLYLGIVLVVGDAITDTLTGISLYLLLLAGIAIGGALLAPLSRRVEDRLNRLLYRERYDHLRALQRLGQRPDPQRSLDGLGSALVEQSALATSARSATLMVAPEAGLPYSCVAHFGETQKPHCLMAPNHVTVMWLKRHQRPLKRHNFPTEPILQAATQEELALIDALDVQVFVPILSNGQLLGILLLAGKSSGGGYSKAEKHLLFQVTAELAPTLQQAVDLKRAQWNLQHKTLLLREVQHRVRNSLSMVVSLLSMELMRMGHRPAEEVVRACIHRVKSIAAIHTLLGSDRPDRIDFKMLVDIIAQDALAHTSVLKKAVTIHTSRSSLVLPASTASALGLVLNELLINAMKYAFVDRDEGEIQIYWYEDEEDIGLIIQDDGVGIPQTEQRTRGSGLGFKIIEALVETDLHGHVVVESDCGTRVSIEFPRGEDASDATTSGTEELGALVNTGGNGGG